MTADASTLLLPTRLAPPPAYYSMMVRHGGPVAICRGERFDKRCKDAHRFTIADTRGPLELTVPVSKPYGRTWATTSVSLHGRWWEVMWAALESAYGRTPFFEFYADDFKPLLSDPDRFTSVADLNEGFDRAIRRAIGLTKEITYVESGRPAEIAPFDPEPYWQLRRDTLGFIPGLSILDMVFNLGPETLLRL